MNAIMAIEEQKALVHYEVIFEQSVREAWNALMAIRDQRLYRAEYRTFEEYCQKRWGISRSYAHRQIEAAAVIENLLPIGNILPANEAQARPLTSLEPGQQRQVWQQVVETVPDNGRITAAHVSQVVREMTAPASQPDPEPSPAPKMAVHFSSGTDEHCTPPEIVEAVLACMGKIDLDPCSNSKEQPNIPAGQHFTAEDDGLAQEWQGRVYMNPPYGRAIDRWVEKLCAEFEAGRIVEAIALVPARTDTQWWVRLRDYVVCFVEGRLKFTGGNSAPFPSAVFYLGSHVEQFCTAFYHLGDIWQRIEPGGSQDSDQTNAN